MATPRRRSRVCKIAWLSAVALLTGLTIILLKGCTATVVAPQHVQDPVAVYILDYGRHPSLVLPRSDFELVEYSYGEWEWYAMNRTGVGDIFRALFISSQGTLGRREIFKPYDGAPWWDELPAQNLHLITVERDLAEDLLADLDRQWEAAADTAVYNHLHDLDMVLNPQPYHAFTNSNVILGRWLEQLDCTVRGWTLYPVHWRVIPQ